MACEGTATLFDNATRVIVKRTLNNFKNSFSPIHGYLSSGICIFGIITNVIHIVVLNQKTMRNNSVNTILTAVAVCDLGVMLSYLIYLIYYVLLPTDNCFIGMRYNWVLFAIGHVFISIYLHTTSLWLVVVLAFMRVMVLKFPIYFEWQKSERAVKMSIITYVMLFFLSLPTLLLQQIVNISIPVDTCKGMGQNGTVSYYFVTLSDVSRKNQCQLLRIELLFIGSVFKIFPCILLGAFSIWLIWKLRTKANKKHKLIKRSAYFTRANKRADQQTTITLVLILVIFLISELPQGILTMAGGIYTTDVYFYIYGGIADILDLLALINSSVNFWLYCLMSSKYRNAFCRLFGYKNQQETEKWRSETCISQAVHMEMQTRLKRKVSGEIAAEILSETVTFDIEQQENGNVKSQFYNV